METPLCRPSRSLTNGNYAVARATLFECRRLWAMGMNLGAGRRILFLGPNPDRVINELQRFL